MKFFNLKLLCVIGIILLGFGSILKADNAYYTQDNIRYVMEETYKNAIVCQPENGSYSGNIVIPASISYNDNNYKVYLGFKVFQDSNIETITFPENIAWMEVPEVHDNGGLASSGFELNDKDPLTDANIAKNYYEMVENAKEQFKGCNNLKSINQTDADGNIVSNGCMVYHVTNAKSSPTERNYLVYLPYSFSGSLDLSQMTSLYFDSEIISNHPSIENIVFPKSFSRFEMNGFENCPALSSFTLESGDERFYHVVDGVLFYQNMIQAMPTAHRETYEYPSGLINSIGNYGLAYCYIDNLVLNGSVSARENAFKGFRGNITLKEQQYPTSNFFTTLAEADSQNFTLYCDPSNHEEAAKYWKGEIKSSEVYVKDLIVGKNSVKVILDGTDEGIAKVSKPVLTNSKGSLGKAYSTDGGRNWIIYGINHNIREFLYLHLYLNDGSQINTLRTLEAGDFAKIEDCLSFNYSKQLATTLEVDMEYERIEGLEDWVNITYEEPYNAYLTNKGDHLVLSGMQFNQDVYIYGNYETYLNDQVQKNTFSFSVKPKEVNINTDISTTQTTITVNSVEIENGDESIGKLDQWVTHNAAGYMSSPLAIGETQEGLNPEKVHTIYLYVDYFKNNYFVIASVETEQLTDIVLYPTSIEVNFIEGDASINNVKIYPDSQWKNADLTFDSHRAILKGLKPGTTYSDLIFDFSYTNGEIKGSYEKNMKNVTLPKLELQTLPVKVGNDGTAVVSAETNLSNQELNGGFQWKKYDAPETLQPNEANSFVYNGLLEGTIKNLQLSSYYNVRAFYKANDGTYYYGDWVTFDPSDISYFEPKVYTNNELNIAENQVTLKGYALQGSDPIVSQGFEYWINESVTRSDNDIMVVYASGQVMTATLEDLPEGDYTYRAFVLTDNDTFYGEEGSFSIKSAGIREISPDEDVNEIIGYFDLSGKKYDKPHKGINIILFKNGKTRKVIF